MKIVADKNMPFLAETFGRHGELQLLNGRGIRSADLAGAEVLLVRSVTQVNEQLLQGTSIRFVGSATIGIDHLDTVWMEENNIKWAHAPGCNANAASQYALAMMWLACERLNRDFREQTVGIVGRGNVGRRLEHLLQALNIPVMSCDPPLRDLGAPQLVSMDEVCDNSIISLHVPLTSGGRYPTKLLFSADRLETLRPNTLLVNTSRGGVIEKAGLLSRLQSGRLQAALDVWPDEPYITGAMLAAVCVATPHVAGYSREGKQAGTEMIYQAFCELFELNTSDAQIPAVKTITLNFPPATAVDEAVKQAVQSSSQVTRDDIALRNLQPTQAGDSRVQIDSLRASYPERNEFKSHKVHGISSHEARQLKTLGFQTI